MRLTSTGFLATTSKDLCSCMRNERNLNCSFEVSVGVITKMFGHFHLTVQLPWCIENSLAWIPGLRQLVYSLQCSMQPALYFHHCICSNNCHCNGFVFRRDEYAVYININNYNYSILLYYF